jgi:prepilin-type N-terminal cleavage/methylation domain-containing protein
MKNKHRGMTLIELLTAIVLLTAVVIVSTPLFASLLEGMTRGPRTVQTDRTIAHLLDRLRQDARGARSFALAPRPDGHAELGLGRDGIDAFYDVRDGNVIRTSGDGNEQTCWALPDATIQWQFWPATGQPQALEVRTSVAEIVNGVTRQKLSRTHLVFFDGVQGRDGK